MTELTKTDFRLATMLTRVAVLASAMLILASCYDIIYEPVFVPEEDNSDFIPYDKEVIPAEGDTCWFYRELNRIVVKAFDPSEAIYPYRWKLLIDGNMVQENTREYLETYSKEVMEWWERRTGLKWMDNAILFEVPVNSSIDERSVEVMVSVSNGLYNSEQEDDWGEWETVFSAVQEGFEIEVSEAGRILVDYECFVAGKDSETVSSLIGSDPLFMDNGIWKFIEYDIASPTGKIGIEVYDAKGDLLDTGSIMNFGNRCEEFPEVFSKILPNNQVVSQLLWDVNFENFGRRSFYVLIVKGEGPHGIFGPALEVFLFEDITAEYKSEYDIDYAVKRHHLVYVLADNNLVDDSK